MTNEQLKSFALIFRVINFLFLLPLGVTMFFPYGWSQFVHIWNSDPEVMIYSSIIIISVLVSWGFSVQQKYKAALISALSIEIIFIILLGLALLMTLLN